ncbi:teichoic acid D-Ala incorporation-associated protein DltX [Neobacillus drentensis]
MLEKIKSFIYQERVRWASKFLYYLLILLLLFFMYGFNDASAGSYIYNDF